MNPPERFVSEQGLRDLLARTVAFGQGGGEVALHVRSEWRGNLRWARNSIISSGDTSNHLVTIFRFVRGALGIATTNAIDDVAVKDCVRRAEAELRYRLATGHSLWWRSSERYLRPNLWSDATFAVDAAARGVLQRRLVEPAIAADLLAAGYLEISSIGNGVANSQGLFSYLPQTRARYSTTVRNAKGTGAGWAGTEHEDWRKIDADRLSAVALDKCRRSVDPVALEPGRYTVILEPQAVADLVRPLMGTLGRQFAEIGMPPWAGESDEDGPRSRIGERVVDPRVTISMDPMDPEVPCVPFAPDATPMRAVTWIDAGVLKALDYDRNYAHATLNQQQPLNNTYAFRMAGGPTTVPEMIANTERGLLVTRFVNIRIVEGETVLCAGLTSDGLWLVENGKVVHPVKNFRFRESPLFMLNNLDALGPAQRVLMDQPTMAPALKARDFSFTSLVDAV